MPEGYRIDRYNAKQSLLIGGGGYIILIYLFVLLGIFIHIPLWLFITLFSMLFILPVIFEKRLRNIFTITLYVKADEKGFSYTEPLKNGKEKVRNYEWKNIKAYKFRFTEPSKYTCFSIYLKNGRSKLFVLKDGKNFKEAVAGESIFNVLYSAIQNYNAQQTENRIGPKPGFMLTIGGKLLIISDIGLMIACITLHFITKINPTPFLLGGISTLIGVLAQRKSDKDNFNLLLNMENNNTVSHN